MSETTTDTLDLATLRKAAEAALPWGRDWQVEYDGDVVDIDFGPDMRWPWRIKNVCNFVEEESSDEVVAHIAAANPATVLALLERLAAAERERDHWRAKEDICAQHLQGALHRETELAEELSDVAKLIDDLISAWYGPQPFAWPEMLPEAIVERITEFQQANSPDRMRWQEDEAEDDD